MVVQIAHATPEDERFFAAALTSHRLRIADDLDDPTVEVLAVPHNRAVTAEEMAQLSALKLIVTRSTGYDHIDLAAARTRGISVSNVPEYGSRTVAEFTFGLILSLSRRIHLAYQRSLEGHFSVEGLMGTDLAGKTLGIVGLGKIGRHVSEMAKGFGMKIVVFDPIKYPESSLMEVLSQADFVTLCCPLTSATHHLMDRHAFDAMKSGAFLVNTARGAVVDPTALWMALESGRLAGAALDVLEEEDAVESRSGPLWDRNLALMGHPRVLVTPHLAFDSVEAVQRIRQTTADVIEAFARGEVLNSVF